MTQRIVILGNGIAGVAAGREFQRRLRAKDSVSVSVLGASDQYVFKPLLPDALNYHAATKPMATIFPSNGGKAPVQFKKVIVQGISLDPAKKEVQTSEGPVPFDSLVIALGSKSAYYNIKRADSHTIPLEEPVHLHRMQAMILGQLAAAAQKNTPAEQVPLLRFVIVGAGATGVELAFELRQFLDKAIAKRYPQKIKIQPEIKIIESTNDILPGFSAQEKAYVKQLLKRAGIQILYQSSVTEVTEAHGVTIIDKTHPDSKPTEVKPGGEPIWVAGVKANPLVASLSVEKFPHNQRVKVNPFLELPNRPDIYVIGDAAAAVDPNTQQVLPAMGQVAEQQGAYVARDMLNKWRHQSRNPFSFQNKGVMLSVGPQNGMVRLLDGWLLKGYIGSLFRKWLYRYKMNVGG
ncbi:MAG: FAD-dependent oxidoreductase [Cyanobacteria bacterium]|nr:FAD-dependent oxidoreductase [Cyanobacteriota bacterium]